MVRPMLVAASMAAALGLDAPTAKAEPGTPTVAGVTRDPPLERGKDRMKVKIVSEERNLTATLDDSPAARDFASLLPLDITLEDYASTEKISDLPKRLSIDAAPAGITPVVGDIAYYAPWGNLAIFYRDFRYSRGLIKLGSVKSGIEVLARSGAHRVRIELVD